MVRLYSVRLFFLSLLNFPFFECLQKYFLSRKYFPNISFYFFPQFTNALRTDRKLFEFSIA